MEPKLIEEQKGLMEGELTGELHWNQPLGLLQSPRPRADLLDSKCRRSPLLDRDFFFPFWVTIRLEFFFIRSGFARKRDGERVPDPLWGS